MPELDQLPPEGNLPAATPETEAPDAKVTGDDKQETFSRDYVKQLRDEAAKHRKEARDLQKRLEELDTARKGEEDKKLAEQNEWRTLAEKRQAELDAVKAEAAKERLNMLRLKVGIAHKLPDKLIERLQGASEEELNADAEALVEALGLDKQAETPAETTTAQQTGRKPATTTTANPSGQPVVNNEAERRAKYFGGASSSPMFNKGELKINYKGG